MADSRELSKLIADLESTPDRMVRAGRAVLQKGALNIKTDWRRTWSGHPHFPALPYAVTYETAITGTTAKAEIGPDKDKPQGALGNLIEFGSVNNPPIPGGLPALQAEEPRFVQALADAAERAALP